MVQIAEQIKLKLARKELNQESDEIKEIQAVMFNMGMADAASNFASAVNKDIAGKNFHSQLAMEIEKFLGAIIDKFGGVIGLIDLYCMYNRARGTDLISPEDLNIACRRLNISSKRFFVKEYTSGVTTIQSRKLSIFFRHKV